MPDMLFVQRTPSGTVVYSAYYQYPGPGGHGRWITVKGGGSSQTLVSTAIIVGYGQFDFPAHAILALLQTVGLRMNCNSRDVWRNVYLGKIPFGVLRNVAAELQAKEAVYG